MIVTIYQPTRRELVLKLLQSNEWVTTMQINDVAVGGSEGTKRLRELRAMGYPIETRRRAIGTQWEYRLIPESEIALSE